jgi:hypothetical protein
MDFGPYLVFAQYIRKEEYNWFYKMQHKAIYENWPEDREFYATHLKSIPLERLREIRANPFGEVLANDNDPTSISLRHGIGGRHKVNSADKEKFQALVDKWIQDWHIWHLENLEPICNYSLKTKIGKQLYENQLEKKYVGDHVATHIVRDGDTVAVPEGSSACYVGMAIAKQREDVRIITSNDPLIRETRDNPMVASRYKELISLSGFVKFMDKQRWGHGGVFGEQVPEQYRAAMEKPGATVVIVPVWKLRTWEGPIDTDHDAASCKREIVIASLEKNVRKIVFIADHTKHVSDTKDQGREQFGKKEWDEMLKEHQDRLVVVSCPPPRIRKAIQEGKLGPTRSRALSELHQDDHPYHQVSAFYAAALGPNFVEAPLVSAMGIAAPHLKQHVTGT